MTNDTELIRKALDGNQNAFGRLVASYQNRLFSSMVHVVGRADEAEDVVQDTFVQAFLKLDSFDARSSFFTWLYRIAFRIALNRQRAGRAEVPLTSVSEMGALEPSDKAETPEEYLLREERAVEIRSAINRLSSEYRTVIVLREMDNLDYHAIAEILDISVGTVRSRLHRARSLLREHLRQVRDG